MSKEVAIVSEDLTLNESAYEKEARARIGQEVLDRETGELLILNEEDYRELVDLEIGIKMAAAQLARNLHRIKQRKLFLFYGFETFGEYVNLRLGMSDRNARRYISLADKFGNSPIYTKIMELDISTALTVASDEDFVDQVNQENSAMLDTILEHKVTEIKRKNKELKEQLKTLQAKAKHGSETLVEREKAYTTEIDRLKGMIDSMASERGIDPERLKSIRSKDDLIKSIVDAEFSLNKSLRRLTDFNLPEGELQPLVDAEVAVNVNRLLGMLADWQSAIQEHYSAELFSLRSAGNAQSEDFSDVPA